MNYDVALQAGVAAFVLQFSLAAWAAICILDMADPRKSCTPWIIFLSAAAIACSLYGIYAVRWPQASQWSTLGWWFSLASGLAIFFIHGKSWLSTTPTDLHHEARRLRMGASPKKGKLSTSVQSSTAAAGGVPLVIAILGFSASGLAAVGGSRELSSLHGAALSVATAHYIIAPVLLGTAIVCGLELTILSAPDSLAAVDALQVHWKGIANLALTGAVLELALCVLVFTSPALASADGFQSAVLVRLFAFTLMVISYIVWMIPHRIVAFQEKGNPRGWVALALAAWLAALGLASVCALPADWPWSELWA